MVSFLVPFMGGPTSDNITDELLVHLRSLPRLELLILEDCDQITDAGLQHVAQLKSLTRLHLEQTAIFLVLTILTRNHPQTTNFTSFFISYSI